MLDELKGAASAYAFGGRTLTRLVGDFTSVDWGVRDAAGHDARWIVGHLATYRKRVAAMIGAPAPAAPWEEAFARGTSPADVPGDLDMGEVLAAFQAATDTLAGAWENVTAEAMGQPFERTLPDGTNTVGGAVRFMAWHDAYHLGQLGLMRRLAKG